MMGRLLAAALIVIYLGSGIYLIRGNEQGVVRRFGRLDPIPRAGGLHYDWPWPFASVDRVNRSEARTIGIGIGTRTGPSSTRPVVPTESTAGVANRDPLRAPRQPEYLTGDKNILHVQVQLQYTIADPAAWLFRNSEIERILERRVESLLVDRIAECGVDYVHPVGLPELQQDLLVELRRDPLVLESGVMVEDVSIPQVSPPVEVKASFLDVSTARAERDQVIARETAVGERRVSDAQAQSRQTVDLARSFATAALQSAKARSESLSQLLIAVRSVPPGTDEHGAAQQRERVMQRLFIEFLEVTFPRLKRITFVAPGSSTDLLMPGIPSAPFPQADVPTEAKSPGLN